MTQSRDRGKPGAHPLSRRRALRPGIGAPASLAGVFAPGQSSDPGHLVENMGGGRGALPDAEERRRMEEVVA